jgi:hypothetical protein
MERHCARQVKVVAVCPLYEHAQPLDAKRYDAQSSDAKHYEAKPASCQSLLPSPRQLEPRPCLRSPDLVRALRPSAIRRNAHRLLRSPVRCPRQPRQRSTSAAPSCARYGDRQLKKDILNAFPTTSHCFVLGCPCFVAMIYYDGHSSYWAVRWVFGKKSGN